MQMSFKRQAKYFMHELLSRGECFDSAGEVSPTELAEITCDEFDAWCADDDIPEIFFELASDVMDEWEAAQSYEEPAIEDDYAWIRTGC